MKRVMISFLCIILLLLNNPALAEIEKHTGSIKELEYDFAKIDWTLTKQDYLDMLENISFEEWKRNDNSSVIKVNAYCFHCKAEIYIELDSNGEIESIDVSFDDLSPIYTIAVLSSNLGIPEYFNDSFGEDTGYSYYLWHYAIWLSDPSAIFVYNSDDELYYQINEDEREVQFDAMCYDPEIRIYKWSDYDELIDSYDIRLP